MLAIRLNPKKTYYVEHMCADANGLGTSGHAGRKLSDNHNHNEKLSRL